MNFPQQFKSCINDLFGYLLETFKEDEEYGYFNFSEKLYTKLGYATNITPEIILEAAKNNIDVLVTHHDAWDFVYGMKDKCHELLMQYNIAHFYIHLPLDYAEFGTCHSLLRLIGVNRIIQHSFHRDGQTAVGIGEYDTPQSFGTLIDIMTNLLGEPIYYQQNNNNDIKRVGLITGAGHETSNLREALENKCDVYITGEKSLYTVQYAKFVQMNIIVGSHTFTEIFGVRSLAKKIKERFPDIELIQLTEEHNEAMGT